MKGCKERSSGAHICAIVTYIVPGLGDIARLSQLTAIFAEYCNTSLLQHAHNSVPDHFLTTACPLPTTPCPTTARYRFQFHLLNSCSDITETLSLTVHPIPSLHPLWSTQRFILGGGIITLCISRYIWRTMRLPACNNTTAMCLRPADTCPG